MSSAPVIRAGGGSGKNKTKKPNAIRRIMEHEQRVRDKSVALSSSTSTPAAGTTSNRPVCKNPHCDKSDVRDGACQNCGRVVWESNIVAEVTFGESANGAAVVHGSYLAADQGGIRPTASGPAFRRVAGAGASEARERSLKEAKQLMNQFAHQLQIAPYIAEKAFQVYKVAANSNFIQGRRKNTVAAVCIYAICRKEDNNKVMLIDLADIIKTDVFLLGRCYKDLLNSTDGLKEGTKPIIIEDLIFRFATKLEFLHDTNKVALSAIRIAQRMRHDNITHGRRPAGICGAALIMAARAHNYRRTVREVVYIAKVTMATLQERMEEFANVPSAQMTIRDFHEAKALPEASHDPPFVYKQTKEWQEKHPKKARKRKVAAVSQDSIQASNGSEQQNPAKRQKTAANEPQANSVPIDPALVAESASTETSTTPAAPASQTADVPTTNVDKDGFVVPYRKPTDEDITIANAATADVDGQLEDLAGEFGEPEEEEEESDEEEVDPSSEMAMAAAQGIQVPGMENMKIKPREAASQPENGDQAADSGDGAGNKKKEKPVLRIDEEWELDEQNLEQEMQGHLNDPAMIGASAVVTKAIEQRREQEEAARASRALPAPDNNPATPNSQAINNPSADNTRDNTTQTSPSGLSPWFTPVSKVSDDPIVHEDEFKDDPEVMFCKLSEKDVLLKEMIWANHNKDYMRKVQQKIFEAKVSSKNPPKQKRSRAKKPRIGEGQATPAGSAAEAAENMLRTRAISTKLDYSRMGNLFEFSKRGPGSTYGGTSSVGSRSVVPSSAGSDAGSDNGGDSGANDAQTPTPTTTAATPALTARERAAQALAPPEEEEEEEHDNGFGGEEGFQDETFGEEEFDPFGDNNGGDEYEE
jgi:transcription factor IIIB subunit 2